MERSIYNDIPKGKFHSALLTTYSLNLHYFEGSVLRILREKKIFSVNVFVDQTMLEEAFSSGLTTNNVRELGKSYSVNSVYSQGAFHPKINLFIGDNSLLAILGSGNISAGGHGKNHEMFTGFIADTENNTQLPLLVELWSYIVGYSIQSNGYFKQRVLELGEHCDLLQNTKVEDKHCFHTIDSVFDAALIYNESHSSILEQLISLITFKEVTEISIMCPYYDKNGDLVNELCNLSPNATVSLYMQKEGGIYPIASNLNDNVRIYDFDVTERGSVKKMRGEYSRFLHAKILHFKTHDSEYCLIGSANASVAAIGVDNRPAINDEFCVLYKSCDYNFLKEFGVIKRHELMINDIVPEKHDSITSSNHLKMLKLTAVDHMRNSLLLYIDAQNLNVLDEEFIVQVYGSLGNIVFESELIRIKSELEVKAPENTLKFAQYVVVVNIDGRSISNRQPINHLSELANTDPERVARFWRAALNEISVNGKDVLKIVKVLFDIDANTTSNSDKRGAVSSQRAQTSLPNISYDEAVEKLNTQNEIENIIGNNTSLKIWDNITQYLKNRMQQLTDASMNEEELGKTTESSQITHRFDNGKESAKTHSGDVNKITKQLVNWYLAEAKSSNVALSAVNYGQLSLTVYLITLVCFQSVANEKSIGVYIQAIIRILECYAQQLRRREQMIYETELSHLELKHNICWEDATKYALLSASLIRTLSNEPVVVAEVNVVCYNIIQNSPKKAQRMDEFITNTIIGCNLRLHPAQIGRMYENIISEANSGKYQCVDKRGVCAIKDMNDKNSCRVTSIYDKGLTIVNNKNLSKFHIAEYL